LVLPKRLNVRQATITIDGPLNAHHDFGGHYIAVTNGGRLELHGSAPAVPWTQLSASVDAGQTTKQTVAATGWQAGDRLVIASSSYDPYAVDEVNIISVDGNEIVLDRPLRSAHNGELQDIAGYEVDERAEVALLNRNIVIQGPSYAHRRQAGVHTVIMEGGEARISGVEFRNAGQLGGAGRYPLHWHRVGDVVDQWVRNSSIHKSFHRCVVAHDTNGLEVNGNVTFDSQSHCFVPAESGREKNNVFENNLMVLTARVAKQEFAFPRNGFGGSNQSEHRPGGFWMRNIQHNVLRGNHVAGVYNGQGFFFDNRFRSHPPRVGRNPVTVAPGTYRFDGGQRRIIPHRADQSPDNGVVEFTFGADDISVTQGLISKDAKTYTDGGHFTVRLVDSRLWFRVQSNRKNYILQSEPLASNETYRVKVRFGLMGMRLWVNDKYQSKNTYRGGLGRSSGGLGNSEPVVIGANSYAAGPLATGR
jgi:hypothetical protein